MVRFIYTPISKRAKLVHRLNRFLMFAHLAGVNKELVHCGINLHPMVTGKITFSMSLGPTNFCCFYHSYGWFFIFSGNETFVNFKSYNSFPNLWLVFSHIYGII